MSSLQARPSKSDDNMALSTPNFFNSAWNPEQSDFSFTDNQGNMSNYDDYTQNYSMSNGEPDNLDYFSGRPGDEFGNQYQSQFLQDPSNDDIGRILTPGLSFLNMDVEPEINKVLGGPTSYSVLNQAPAAQGLDSYSTALVFGPEGLEALPAGQWSNVKPQDLKDTNFLENNNQRSTAVMHGQITPGDSPQDEDKTGKANLVSKGTSIQNDAAPNVTRGKRPSFSSKPDIPSNPDESVPRPAKKARKSKKKPITREQEEAKRKRFLERNRVAADKCRQNRKKWIDDLQEKCHSYSADNAAKKAALDEMEHELMQMKNMLLLHSQTCKDHKILDWVDRESKKLCDNQAAETTNLEKTFSCTDAASPLGQYSSSSRDSTVEPLKFEDDKSATEV